MITIPHPSLALNSIDFDPAFHYALQYEETIYLSHSVRAIVTIILVCANNSADRLNVVINSHGLPGEIYLGEGIVDCQWAALEPELMRLRGRINTLYLCCCKVASGPVGAAFCQRLADLIDANVIASEMYQRSTGWDHEFLSNRTPRDMIDDFEGMTWRFRPNLPRVQFSFVPVTVSYEGRLAPMTCSAIAGS
ncbi:DUF4347 domain-containing protein [Viridibacterium curvum]|uniref:DUF4347 domain-containing protein n=1 Tax=Viridibacterium curvum TaxID=1101404 RepID=A0ABP9QTK4_9RHOO